MVDAVVTNATGSGDLLGRMIHPLTWVWERCPYATPLIVLSLVIAVRALGWHAKFLPFLSPVLESLTKSPDLAACFPGLNAQQRLRFLLEKDATSSAMHACEGALGPWPGP